MSLSKKTKEALAMQRLVLLIFTVHFCEPLQLLFHYRKLWIDAARAKEYKKRKKQRLRMVKLEAHAKRKAEKLRIQQEKEWQKELKRRKHASKKAGFLDGWGAVDKTLQNPEQWSTRYKNAYAEAQATRAKFQAQCQGQTA
jgi:hypothetical protein